LLGNAFNTAARQIYGGIKKPKQEKAGTKAGLFIWVSCWFLHRGDDKDSHKSGPECGERLLDIK
jgi:hypothetical protein